MMGTFPSGAGYHGGGGASRPASLGRMRRSFWAWGWEERLPDQAARAALGAQIAAALGSPASEPRPLPALDQATAGVPAPAVAPPTEIADICDPSPEARLRHTYGRAYRDLVRGFACDFSS